jgi:protease YdgD
LPGSAVSPVAVFGDDNRIALPMSHIALEDKIGLLYESRSRSVCTAFCVADDIVATAGHCLYRTSEERPPRLANFTFRLTGKNVKTTARIAGADKGEAAQNIMAGSLHLSVKPPIDASHDWALVRLARPVCKGARLKLSRRTATELIPLAAKSRVYQVAFHRDFANWRLAYASPCDVRRKFETTSWDTIARDFAEPNQLILHSCDTGGASSGSPLLIDGPSGPEVVGINVGTYVQSKVMMQNGKVVHRFKADTIANTGVSAAAIAPALEAFERAEILVARDRMKELQKLLMARGLYAGPADGIYGPRFRDAIESFERTENRPVTGLATQAVLKRLTALEAEGHPVIAVEGSRLETGSVSASAPDAPQASRR